MKNLIKWIAAITFGMTALSACNSSLEDSGSASTIKPGVYEQMATLINVGNKQISYSPAKGIAYVYKNFHFFKGDSLIINVKSDIPSDMGQAHALYTVSGKKIHVSIQRSTTAAYPAGSRIIFNSFQMVNSNYSRTFHGSTGSYVFNGPGLILKKQHPDRNDLDQDGNMTETVDETQFYKYNSQELLM